nr:hypothetical protein HmN_000327900 [Hymenolepis microstoma]
MSRQTCGEENTPHLLLLLLPTPFHSLPTMLKCFNSSEQSLQIRSRSITHHNGETSLCCIENRGSDASLTSIRLVGSFNRMQWIQNSNMNEFVRENDIQEYTNKAAS